jgi:hypothetical protein
MSCSLLDSLEDLLVSALIQWGPSTAQGAHIDQIIYFLNETPTLEIIVLLYTPDYFYCRVDKMG